MFIERNLDVCVCRFSIELESLSYSFKRPSALLNILWGSVATEIRILVYWFITFSFE